jgi:hypothetical protein
LGKEKRGNRTNHEYKHGPEPGEFNSRPSVANPLAARYILVCMSSVTDFEMAPNCHECRYSTVCFKMMSGIDKHILGGGCNGKTKSKEDSRKMVGPIGGNPKPKIRDELQDIKPSTMQEEWAESAIYTYEGIGDRDGYKDAEAGSFLRGNRAITRSI